MCIRDSVDGVAVSKKMKNSDICSEAAIMLKDILKASIKNINSDIGFNDRFTYGSFKYVFKHNGSFAAHV